MEILDLGSIAGNLIGNPGEGLTAEQRKRVTIGVELVSEPMLLFLDEPTSGLDSVAAARLMDSIKQIATAGISSNLLGNVSSYLQ